MASDPRTERQPLPETEGFWIGEPTVGGWCAPCALPSQWSNFLVVTVHHDPTRVLLRGRYTTCLTCHAYTFERAPH